MTDIDSIWHYFVKAGEFVKCKNCDHSVKQDSTKSTGNLIRHLNAKHPDLEKQRQKEIERKKKLKDRAIASIPKITTFASSAPCSSQGSETGEGEQVPEKRMRFASGGNQNPTIVESFSKFRNKKKYKYYLFLQHNGVPRGLKVKN